MADTKRTSADLLANLFQDGQAAGSITPQDMRDLIVTMVPSYGNLYLTVPATNGIALTATPEKAAGTTSWISGVDMDDNSVSNRIRYTGTITRRFVVTIAISMTSTAVDGPALWTVTS